MSSWTHACCEECWDHQQPGRTPHRMGAAHRLTETCCYCGVITRSGIYVRENPTSVPFPSKES